jgi:aspartate/methionine/tyrosine aminotransferase
MRRLARGKYAAKARRSFAVALVDPEIFARFGSSEAVNAALRAVLEAADSIMSPKPVPRRPRSRKSSAAH